MPAPDLPPVKCLLVDDLEENLIALAALLRRADLELYTARSAREALELLLQHEFALALIDVQMPEMDGFELAELMRGSERCRHLPIIFATAGAHEPSRIFQGYESGAVDFLFKPIEPHVLRQKVDVFCALYRQRLQLAQQVREREVLLRETRETLRLNEMFTAALSHDLRTPLSAVVAGASLLKQSESDELTQRVASRILSSGRRMAEMIEQLLDLSRARLSGGIPVEPKPMELRPMIERIVAEAQATAPQRTIAMHCHGDLGGRWDEGRLGQVLSNLVTNAVRHGAPGPVTVSAYPCEHERVALSVENAGVIPRHLHAQLFDPFRSGVDNAARAGGLGLGLYIVKHIVEAHGGEIELRSDAANGTRFLASLPRAHLQAGSAQSAQGALIGE